MSTKVIRLALDSGFDAALTQVCDNYLTVGYRLAALVVVGTEMLVVFQKL